MARNHGDTNLSAREQRLTAQNVVLKARLEAEKAKRAADAARSKERMEKVKAHAQKQIAKVKGKA